MFCQLEEDEDVLAQFKGRQSRILEGLLDLGRPVRRILGQADGADNAVEGRRIFSDAVEVALAQTVGLIADGYHEFLDFIVALLADSQVGDHLYERCRRSSGHSGDAAAAGNGFLGSRDFQEPVEGHGLEMCKIHLRTIP